jgi:uncharacterized membrane protein
MEHTVLAAIEILALVLEVLAAAVIGVGVLVATLRLARVVFAAERSDTLYIQYKQMVAKSLLLGLEILIAADIVRTIALEPTTENLLALGLLALIRTFLTWSLVVEVEGHWPWQPTLETREDTV